MRSDSVLSQYNSIPYVFVASQASVWEASYWQHQQPGVLTTSTELVMFSFIVCMALCGQLLRPLSRYMHRRLVILLKIMHVDTVQAIACGVSQNDTEVSQKCSEPVSKFRKDLGPRLGFAATLVQCCRSLFVYRQPLKELRCTIHNSSSSPTCYVDVAKLASLSDIREVPLRHELQVLKSAGFAISWWKSPLS